MFKIKAVATQKWELNIHHLLLFFSYFHSYSSAQKELIRTANLSTSWLNTGSINYVGVGPNGSWIFSDGSNLRPILVHQQSYERDYALGFFRFGNRNSSNSFFLVILMFEMDTLGTDSPAAVVWTANREKAVRDNATLEFDASGDLILRDVDGTLVWSTNTTGLPATTVQLEGSNLMLVNTSFSPGGVFWQSYNYPTDTWLSSQQLRVGQKLTSSITVSNLSSGKFYLAMTAVGLQAFLDSDPPQLYATIVLCVDDYPPGYAGYEYDTYGSFNCYPSYVQHLAYIDTFVKLELDGRLKYYTMLSDGFRQNEVFKDNCTYATFCGSCGVCSNGHCDCPQGAENSSYFQQTSPGEPQKGCDPITPLSCQHAHLHTFLELPRVIYYDFVPSLLTVNAERCKQACLNNCSCIAALFQPQPDNVLSGNCSLHSHLLSLRSTHEEDAPRSYTFLKVQKPPPGVPSKAKTSFSLILILLPTLLVGILFICLVAGWRYYYIVMIKKVEDIEEEEVEEDEVVEGLARFTLEGLRSATQDFRVKLGQGGFGSVFEGTLQNGTKVAVKRLENLARKEFLAEVMTIGSIHHYNLVKLLGYCSRRSNKLLVYELVANGSLDKWIFHQNRAQTLSWETRHKIILGIARGLEYLHVHCDPNVIHFDIKPQNILLDGEFNVKIADFGLAKLIDRDQSHVLLTRAKGTLGYVAPELFTGRNVSTKVDVYSFGILILETMCGRKNIISAQVDPLIDLVRIKAEEDQLAELIDVVVQSNTEEAVKMIKVAIWCLQPPYNRPSMSMVVNVLVGLADIEPITNYEFLSMVQFGNPLEAKPSVSPPPEASIISGPR